MAHAIVAVTVAGCLMTTNTLNCTELFYLL